MPRGPDAKIARRPLPMLRFIMSWIDWSRTSEPWPESGCRNFRAVPSGILLGAPMMAGMAIHLAMGTVEFPLTYGFTFGLFLVAGHSGVPIAPPTSRARAPGACAASQWSRATIHPSRIQLASAAWAAAVGSS